MKKFSLAKFAALGTALVLGLSACGGGSSEPQTDANGETVASEEANVSSDADPDTLRVVQTFDPGTFEPGNNDEQSYNRIMAAIYDPLFRYDENGELQPWLCESYEWDDPTHLRLHLREGVKFSDGSDFTADDVVWTFEHAIDTNLPNSHFQIIDRDDMVVEDPLTCVIGLKYPCGTMPNHLANPQCVIGSKKAFEEGNGDWLGASVVGTGAYKLDEYVQGDVMRFSANENYWREGKPGFKKMEMRYVASGDAKATEAKTGNYDVVLAFNSREYDNIENTPGMSVVTAPTAKTVYLLINCKKAPMDNPKVREAFARAIDVKSTVMLAYGQVGMPAEAFIVPGLSGANEETYRKYYGEGADIETAKKLLADAGYPDGVDIEITVESNDEQRADMAEAMQAQVAEAGIRLSVNKMDNSPMREYLARGDHQICIYGFTASTMEADGFLNQIQPGSDALSRVGYENQEFFDKYQEVCAMTDPEERKQGWEDCLEMLMKDYVMIPLNHQQNYAAVNDRVGGVWLAKDYEELYYEDMFLK